MEIYQFWNKTLEFFGLYTNLGLHYLFLKFLGSNAKSDIFLCGLQSGSYFVRSPLFCTIKDSRYLRCIKNLQKTKSKSKAKEIKAPYFVRISLICTIFDEITTSHLNIHY